MLVGGFVRWQQGNKRAVYFSFAWLGTDFARCVLIVLSAGDHGMIDRNSLVWLLRWMVVLEHGILASMVVPFILENTTLGRKKQ